MKRIAIILFLLISIISKAQLGNFYWSYQPVSEETLFGKRQLAIVGTGDVYLSTDYGVTWTAQLGINKNWRRCDVSDNVDYALVCEEGSGYVEKGFPFQAETNLSSAYDWDAVAVSGTGQYQVAVSTTATGSFGYVYYSTNYASSWTQSTVAANYWQIADISGNGQYSYISDTGSNLLLSTDFGATFSPISLPPSATDIYDISVDFSGQMVYVMAWISGNMFLYKSVNYGSSWSLVSNVNSSINNYVSMSSTGQYVTYCEGSTGHIHYSSDYGANWNLVTLTGLTPTGVDLSKDGKHQLVSTTTYLYYSSDYGVNWSQLTSAGNRTWKDVGL